MNIQYHYHQSHLRIQRWIALKKKQGFTPSFAYDLAQALNQWASPWFFCNQAFNKKPILKKFQKVYSNLKENLEKIESLQEWQDFQILNQGLTQGLTKEWWENYKDLLSLDGPSEKKISNQSESFILNQPMNHFKKMESWENLEKYLLGNIVLPHLMIQSDVINDKKRISLEESLEKTGLQSIRWGWFEEITTEMEEDLAKTLCYLQEELATPLGWSGPILGLNFETALILTRANRAENTGQVILNQHQLGQQLSLDTWEVLPHEWLHTLDCTLARSTNRQHQWTTLSIVEGDENLPSHLILKESLLHWWEQVMLIQFSPLPDAVYEEIKIELQHWPNRILNSFGEKAEVKSRIKKEQSLIQKNQWNEQESQQRWLNFLNQSYPHLNQQRRHRTASLIAGEIRLALNAHQIPLDEPVWIGFLNSFTDTPEPHKTCTDCHAYLVNPVEVMARSFEVAFQIQDHHGLIWNAPLSQAGMIWPLKPEQQYQKEGWVICFQALKEWWNFKLNLN